MCANFNVYFTKVNNYELNFLLSMIFVLYWKEEHFFEYIFKAKNNDTSYWVNLILLLIVPIK